MLPTLLSKKRPHGLGGSYSEKSPPSNERFTFIAHSGTRPTPTTIDATSKSGDRVVSAFAIRSTTHLASDLTGVVVPAVTRYM